MPPLLCPTHRLATVHLNDHVLLRLVQRVSHHINQLLDQVRGHLFLGDVRLDDENRHPCGCCCLRMSTCVLMTGMVIVERIQPSARDSLIRKEERGSDGEEDEPRGGRVIPGEDYLSPLTYWKLNSSLHSSYRGSSDKLDSVTPSTVPIE